MQATLLARVLAACLALSLPVAADVITGRVVDADGNGVPGVDIDVDNIGSGGDPDPLNDGTDANGFFTTTIPAGIYDVYFNPPPPPTTTHLAAIVRSVVVVGTRDMGVITLPPGVGLFGRVLDGAGLPVGGVNLDVIDVPTGENLVLKGGTTSAFGTFGVAVPAHAILLDLDPGGVIGRTLVPRELALAPAADMQLGDLVLQDGFVLRGTLRNVSGAALANLDVDLFTVPGGELVYTPRDNSSSLGLFSVVLGPGTYDLEICPPLTRRLVAYRQEGIPFAGTTDLGTITLQPGVRLSGTVRSTTGLPVPGVDLDADDSLTGLSIVTCNDNTGPDGTYVVIVPTGTLDVGFAFPSDHGTSGEDLHAALPISGDTVLDGVLPAPAPGFAGTPLAGQAPLTVDFTDLSTGAVTALDWTFGDGGVSTEADPVHTYALPGSYTVSLTATGPGGPVTETRPGYVVVLPPPPVAAFTGTPLSGNAPLEVRFTSQSTGTITGGSWDFGDGTTSGQLSPLHTYTAAGTYTVSLTVNGPGGSDTLTKVDYVSVGVAPPVAEFVGEPTSGLAPLTVGFTNQSTGSVTGHFWSFGDGASSTLASPAHAYGTPGTYSVSLTETGPGGSSTRTRTDYVVVLHPPPVAEFVGTPLRGRAPLVVSFGDLSSGAIATHEWSFGDGTSSTLASPQHVYRSAGRYTVSLTVTGPGGTSTETKLDLVVVQGPLVPGTGPGTAPPVTTP